MTIQPHERIAKAEAKSSKLSEHEPRPRTGSKKFSEMMKVDAVDEENKRRFDNRKKEEEENVSIFSFSLAKQQASAADASAENVLAIAAAVTSANLASAIDAASQSPASAATEFSQELEAIFERMASMMLVMSSAEETQTTLILDQPQFSSSPLYGTQITIREFSAAPKTFNIEIASNPNACHLLSSHAGALMAAFEAGNFSFRVHRFETHILTDQSRPAFARKEPTHNQDQDRGEEQPR